MGTTSTRSRDKRISGDELQVAPCNPPHWRQWHSKALVLSLPSSPVGSDDGRFAAMVGLTSRRLRGVCVCRRSSYFVFLAHSGIFSPLVSEPLPTFVWPPVRWRSCSQHFQHRASLSFQTEFHLRGGQVRILVHRVLPLHAPVSYRLAVPWTFPPKARAPTAVIQFWAPPGRYTSFTPGPTSSLPK